MDLEQSRLYLYDGFVVHHIDINATQSEKNFSDLHQAGIITLHFTYTKLQPDSVTYRIKTVSCRSKYVINDENQV